MMARELEAKLPLPDPPSLRARLAELNAPPVASFQEENRFFDLPGDSLRLADRALRLRTETPRSDAAPPFSVRHCLTHKGPRLRDTAPGLKAREETETDVASASDTAAVLEALGFELRFRFEKRRDRHIVAGCRVEIDELPEIGFFVEVEGPDPDTIESTLRELGLADSPREALGYLSLLRNHAETHSGPGNPARGSVETFLFGHVRLSGERGGGG